MSTGNQFVKLPLNSRRIVPMGLDPV